MATIKNLVIDQGATFTVSIVVFDPNGNELDLTDYTIRAQMRKSYGSNSSTSFTATKAADPTNGEITISLTATQTSALRSGRYVYDIEIEDDEDVVTRVLEGIVTVTPEVTR